MGNQLINYSLWKETTIYGGEGVWENNGVTLGAEARTQYTLSAMNGAEISTKAGETFTLSWEEDTDTASQIILIGYDAYGLSTNSEYIDNSEAKSLTITTAENTEYLAWGFINTTYSEVSFKNIMLNYGTEALAYEEYQEPLNLINLDTLSYFKEKMLENIETEISDYESLENKPSINGVELVGNKTLEDLGITGGGETGTTDYNDLENKPSINGTELSGDITIDIPSKVSELENDSGYLTEIPQQSYNDLENKPSINGTELSGDITIDIPTTLSNGTETAGLIKTSSTVTSNSGYTACPVISGVPYYKDTNTTYNTATTSANGLMTSTMVTKLNGIATGATATSVVNNLTSTSTTAALSAYQGKVLYDSFSNARLELVNALAYSGLGVTEDMTFSEIAEVLAVAFPELYYLYNNGTISALVGSFVQGTKVTSSNTAIAPTFNDDNITLATTSNSQECSVVSSSTVDLTDYSLLGCTILRNDEEIQYTVDISQLSGSYYVGLRHIYQDSLISEWLAVASSKAFNSTYMVAYNNFLYHASPTDSTKTLVIKEIWLK